MNSEGPEVTEASIERRKVRDPQMIRRIRSEIIRVAGQVHKHRLREWAASDTGEFPAEADSQRIAVAEVEYLVRAPGPLAGLSVDQVFVFPPPSEGWF